MSDAVTQYNVGRWCLSEHECIYLGIDFAAYERGVADAAAAFGRNTLMKKPPDYVLVPIVPTTEMVAAMAVEDATGSINGVKTIGIGGAVLAYESMLAAVLAAHEAKADSVHLSGASGGETVPPEHAGFDAWGNEQFVDGTSADIFDAGFQCGAHWAQREDLLGDMDSPAYLRDRAEALAAPPLTPEQEAFCDGHCCWSGHHKDCPRHDPDGVLGTPDCKAQECYGCPSPTTCAKKYGRPDALGRSYGVQACDHIWTTCNSGVYVCDKCDDQRMPKKENDRG